jgi:DNA-directed RNA polymerase subunit RPC12/RpoP
MAEEYTCIECENLYDDMDGDTDERICNKCGCQIYEEQRNPNIKRSSTVHYPDWDMKKKEYVVPPNQRRKQ